MIERPPFEPISKEEKRAAFRKFALHMFGALCVGLILAYPLFIWAGGAR